MPSGRFTTLWIRQRLDDETRTPAYVWLFLAGLTLTIFSGNWAELGMPTGLDRPLLLLSIVLFVLDPVKERLRLRTVWILMAVTVLWTLLSWISTGTLGESYPLFMLLDRIVMPFLMFGLGALIFSTEHRRMLLLRLSALLGTYLGFTAVMERVGLEALIFPRYINMLHATALDGAEWRAFGPFGSAEALGMVAALTFFLSCFLFTRSEGVWRWVAVAGAALSPLANVLSLTRSAWLGLVMGLVASIILVPALRRWIPVFVGGIAVAIVGVFVALPNLTAELTDRMFRGDSLADRANTNAAAMRIIEAEPLTGIGWGQFLSENVLWVRQADTYPVTQVNIEVHNVLLSRAAETGVLGAVLWILVILFGPVMVLLSRARLAEMQAWKVVGWCALLILIVPTMTSPNPYPTPNYLIWLICGIAGRGVLVRLPGLMDPRASNRAFQSRPKPAQSLSASAPHSA
ncbi:O-antigen ligase family protein [Granulicoccus sp. GXG6511]|uniref:O-antigen ligase family protein n=1 Tax=Granulicoccus sp. GXG6511 TaxID=3381351 RepID=UPI003D7C8B92